MSESVLREIQRRHRFEADAGEKRHQPITLGPAQWDSFVRELLVLGGHVAIPRGSPEEYSVAGPLGVCSVRLAQPPPPPGALVVSEGQIRQLVESARAEERERCAAFLDAEAEAWASRHGTDNGAREDVARELAADIRALK